MTDTLRVRVVTRNDGDFDAEVDCDDFGALLTRVADSSGAGPLVRIGNIVIATSEVLFIAEADRVPA